VLTYKIRALEKVIEKATTEPKKRKSRAKNPPPEDLEVYKEIPGFPKYRIK
jgi:hypothetical protein